MKNHQFRPTRSVAFLEINATNNDGSKNNIWGRNRGYSRDHNLTYDRNHNSSGGQLYSCGRGRNFSQ